ncbi:hypothetical protein CPB84DRAFT_1854340 [Gymnopilus junonius]|uniref:Uncharacterized protein n=1 Tax=Gymnopilus junonius TaxID=109634 RepID=A0A9P5NA89_GYMJU|nr:hypothetical protein CPB84DRAFT_1854340 [Gymnopilus junonius]
MNSSRKIFLGERVAWSSFTVKYNGPTTLGDDGKPPVWMTQDHEVWFRDPLLLLEGMIANPDFNGEIDFGPKIVTKDGKRRYKNVMSGKWAWDQQIRTATAHVRPVILGSDKTTVSVATAKLTSTPVHLNRKPSKEYSNDAQYRKFRRQLFHTSLEHILGSVRPYMSKPKVTLSATATTQGDIRLRSYIADYPEQALLACIVQAGVRSESPPQVIKGTFKDHLVDWVESYIRDVMFEGNPKGADAVIADIDRRIACAPPFPGLRHFHEGRGFKQSIFPIAGHLPDQMVEQLQTSLNSATWLDATSWMKTHSTKWTPLYLTSMKIAKFFALCGQTASLFHASTPLFITVDPSSYSVHQMVSALLSPKQAYQSFDEPMSQSEVKLAKTATYTNLLLCPPSRLPELTCRYLYDILNPKASVPGSRAPLDILPTVDGPLRLFNSVRAVYYAPSDLSGIGGMHEERIRAVRKWYNGPPRYDCVFVGNTDAADQPGFRGLNVARRVIYPCALVHWFSHVGNAPDPVTGMWKVKPDYDRRGNPILAVIAVDSIFRGAHLIGIPSKLST